jgi:hypothetical protein
MSRIIEPSLVALVLAAGCSGGGLNTDYPYEHDEPETRTWPAAGITHLEVDTPNGSITVAVDGSDPISADITRSCRGEDLADAQAHIDDITITETVTGDTLRLEAAMPSSNDRSYNTEFDVSTPVLEHMDLSVANGSITVADHEGSIDATVSNGDVDVDLAALGAAGWATLTVTNGEIVLSLPADVSATFDASITNGSVTVTGFDSASYTTDENSHKAGALGAGEAAIDLDVTNGGITIQAR